MWRYDGSAYRCFRLLPSDVGYVCLSCYARLFHRHLVSREKSSSRRGTEKGVGCHEALFLHLQGMKEALAMWPSLRSRSDHHCRSGGPLDHLIGIFAFFLGRRTAHRARDDSHPACWWSETLAVDLDSLDERFQHPSTHHPAQDMVSLGWMTLCVVVSFRTPLVPKPQGNLVRAHARMHQKVVWHPPS